MRVAVLTALAWLVALDARAQTEDNLAVCMARATEAMEQQGARVVGDPLVAFLREGEARSIPFALDENGCVGVLALGHQRVHDIDLVLRTDSGMQLEQDLEVDAHPYLRFCGAAGLRLVATLSMYKGQGEVRVRRFANAPASVPGLDRSLGECFAGGGGVRRPSGEVGPAPPGRPVAEAMTEIARDLSELGYQPVGAEQGGTLSAPGRDAHAIELEAGKCYAIIAAGDARVADLDLFVRTITGAEIARDVSRGAKAVARFCADQPTVVAEVRMFQGNGDYRVRAFALTEPRSPPAPPGVTGIARVGFAEVVAHMRAHGMTARPVAWGLVGPGQALPMPVSLEAGRCYAFGALSADEIREGDLDLILLDDDDSLLAWDVGPGSVPLLFHCAERSGTARIVARVYGAMGRYLVMMGEPR